MSENDIDIFSATDCKEVLTSDRITSYITRTFKGEGYTYPHMIRDMMKEMGIEDTEQNRSFAVTMFLVGRTMDHMVRGMAANPLLGMAMLMQRWGKSE